MDHCLTFSRAPVLIYRQNCGVRHPAGARELVAQAFLCILEPRFTLTDRVLSVRFRAFRIYLLLDATGIFVEGGA